MQNIKYLLSSISFLVLFITSTNGQNLLVNGDFENFSQMPFGPALMAYAEAWEDFIPNTDYLNIGNESGAHMGDGFTGLTTYGNDDNDSEAFGQDISAGPLLADSTYYVELYTRSTNVAQVEITGFPYVPSVPNFNTHPTNLPQAVSLYTTEQVFGEDWVLQYGYIDNIPENLVYIAVSAAKTGAYEYMYIDDILIKVPIPISLSDSAYICSGDSVVLDVSRENGVYLWEDGSISSTFTATAEGIYEVEVRSRDTIFSQKIEVFYETQPAIEIVDNVNFCEGESFEVDATFSDPETQYLWSDGSSSSSFTITETGVYDVQLNLRGCIHFDTIVADVTSFPNVDFGVDTSLCVGDVKTLLATSPDADYLWQDGSTDATFVVTDAGEYAVTVTRNECIRTDAINIDYINIPENILGEDQELCFSETLILDAFFPEATYMWQDSSSESRFIVEEAGTYDVSVMLDGCVREDEIIVEEQIFDCIECDFFIPNAFTPDFDGYNDNLKILTPCAISEYNFTIFDRWGNQVFQSANPDEGWDGTFKNKPMPNGVYTAFVDFRFTARRVGELYRTDVLLTR